MAGEFAMNLRMFVDICRDRGITPVLMTQGNRITYKPDPVVATYIGQYSQDTGVSYQDFKAIYGTVQPHDTASGTEERGPGHRPGQGGAAGPGALL